MQKAAPPLLLSSINNHESLKRRKGKRITEDKRDDICFDTGDGVERARAPFLLFSQQATRHWPRRATIQTITHIRHGRLVFLSLRLPCSCRTDGIFKTGSASSRITNMTNIGNISDPMRCLASRWLVTRDSTCLRYQILTGLLAPTTCWFKEVENVSPVPPD